MKVKIYQEQKMWGKGVKMVDLSECVWTKMTTSLKQVDIFIVNVYEPHGNHNKLKTYNRYTKTRQKGTQAYH